MGQALRQGAAAALWQHALGDIGTEASAAPVPAEGGGGARDRLACAVATALGDLLVYRGDDAVAAAAMLVARDARSREWFGAMVHASRPLRTAAAAGYLMIRCVHSSCSCVGVSTSPATAAAPGWHRHACTASTW